MYTRPSGIVCIMYSSETRSFFIPPGFPHTPLVLFVSHKAEKLGPFYTPRVSPKCLPLKVNLYTAVYRYNAYLCS